MLAAGVRNSTKMYGIRRALAITSRTPRVSSFTVWGTTVLAHSASFSRQQKRLQKRLAVSFFRMMNAAAILVCTKQCSLWRSRELSAPCLCVRRQAFNYSQRSLPSKPAINYYIYCSIHCSISHSSEYNTLKHYSYNLQCRVQTIQRSFSSAKTLQSSGFHLITNRN